jgi:hypothetical protein
MLQRELTGVSCGVVLRWRNMVKFRVKRFWMTCGNAWTDTDELWLEDGCVYVMGEVRV